MSTPHKLFYKGSSADFVIFVESPEILAKYHKGENIPLIDIVSIYKVFVNRQGGVEGKLDEASKEELQNEFGPKAKADDAIRAILESGADKSGVGAIKSDDPYRGE